jgi:hypothetical protein
MLALFDGEVEFLLEGNEGGFSIVVLRTNLKSIYLSEKTAQTIA